MNECAKNFMREATVDSASSPYRGRFAPTPSGALHFGSLVGALGSYLDARAHRGTWLIRIEDADTKRSHASHIDAILKSLEAHGLCSDLPVRRQSHHRGDYEAALERLRTWLYPCHCSRKTWQHGAAIGALGPIYPGHCRHRPETNLAPGGYAIRLRLPDTELRFHDRLRGACRYPLASRIGDPVLRRRDGDIAYALAVVIDDAKQGITHVVRGADLLAATAIQIVLQRLLDLATPDYLHLPLVLTAEKRKLSKQNHAPALNDAAAAGNLIAALAFLGQTTDGPRETDSPIQILESAVKS